jgi:DNA gyrase subunit A
MGRATQGVTLINVDDGSMLSGVRRVVESDVDDEAVDELTDGVVQPDASGGASSNAAADPTDEAGSES